MTPLQQAALTRYGRVASELTGLPVVGAGYLPGLLGLPEMFVEVAGLVPVTKTEEHSFPVSTTLRIRIPVPADVLRSL